MTLDQSQAEKLGTDAFVFGFPLLLMATARRCATEVASGGENGVPVNCFVHLPDFPDPSFRALVGANSETLYSLAWLDLSVEPVVIRLPDTGERSYLMPLVDAWTEVFACLGPRTIGTGGGAFALVGPGWRGDLPGDVTRIDAATNTVWVIGHTHAAGREDLEGGRAVQRSLDLVCLRDFGNGDADGRATELEIDTMPSPDGLLMELSAAEFLGRLSEELAANPATNGDRPMLERLVEIGVRPGSPFRWEELSAETRRAIQAGMARGRQAVTALPPSHLENGWHLFRNGVAAYDADYLHRAQVANAALGVAKPEDAVFPLTTTDSEGLPLEGSRRYVLRFEPGQLPPVGAVWSLALYDMDQLFVANPIDRYALGNRDELELGPDGSLEIVIQHERPEGSDANWLPAPEGDFNLMLHMYWPEQSVLDGTWKIPPVRYVK